MKKSITSLLTSITLLGVLTSPWAVSNSFAQEKQTNLIAQSSREITLTNIGGFKGVITSLALTPDGKMMIVGSNDGQITAINLETYEPMYSSFSITNPYSDIVFSSDGELFAVPSKRGIVLYETKTGKMLNTLWGHTGNISSLAMSPDDRMLVSVSGEDLTFKVWDIATGKLIKDVGENVNSVSTIAFDPSGKYFVTGAGGIGSDRTVKVWDAKTFDLVKTLPTQFGFIYDLAFSPDGNKLVGAVRNYVKVWDLTNNYAELLSVEASPLDLNKVSFSPDGRFIATANREGKIKIIDVNQNRVVNTLSGHTGWVQTLAFSPDGKTLYTGAEDKVVKAWNLADLYLF